MAFGINHLEARYLDCCKRQGVCANLSILASFSKAEVQKSHQDLCCFEIFLDHLKGPDYPLLLEILAAISSSEVDVVDILHESSCVFLNGDSVISLIRMAGQKLRIVDIQDLSFQEEFLMDISHKGMACQVLNMPCNIQKLDMIGPFLQLHTLNLDFSISLTGFQQGCFSCMPNLMRLSLCETRISNLWTTTCALSKLPSLLELRFQNCLCCSNTGPCQASSMGKSDSFAYRKNGSGQLQAYVCAQPTSLSNEDYLRNCQYLGSTDVINDVISDEMFSSDNFYPNSSEESSSEVELGCSGQQLGSLWFERLPCSLTRNINVGKPVGMDYFLVGSSPGPMPSHFSEDSIHSIGTKICYGQGMHKMDALDYLRGNLNGYVNLKDFSGSSLFSVEGNKDGCAVSVLDSGNKGSMDIAKKFISHHPSPICFERNYREYMIVAMPHLKVLDNLPIEKEDRETAKILVTQYYEYLPYNRLYKENVLNVLKRREMGTAIGLQKSLKKQLTPCFSEVNQYCFKRSISAAKIGSHAWPNLKSISKVRSIQKEETRSFRPRQFEYHPCNPGLMVFGTLDGELLVVNHESGKLAGYLPSVGALNSVLGLCWLKKYPSKLIAGSDNGSLQLYDIHQMASEFTDRYCCTEAATFSFEEFEQLTSVHVNSTDENLLVSGNSKHVALYDIGSGRRLHLFKNLHREHINVVKFAHYSPSIFATASFDQNVKMWDIRQGLSRPCYTASSSRGNVMVCFSPNDHYLLTSAVDNEVKQLLAVDGRLHMKLNIVPAGSAQNYTRSYYMNNGDYIISGSCEENVVRICCGQTGRHLRDIPLEGRGSKTSLFVQSLRGDPFQDFHMSVLAAYPNSKSEIIEVNLMASSDHEENSYSKSLNLPYCLGG